MPLKHTLKHHVSILLSYTEINIFVVINLLSKSQIMSTTKLSKLLPDHEKYHHNPIIHKTKSYTFWYSIQNKGVFPKSGLKYTRAPKQYAIPDNFSIITTWGKSPNLNTIKGHIKYIDNRPVYYVNYGPNFELEIISNHSSSDAATKTQRVSYFYYKYIILYL